jgi:predicted Zn-dependent protease with MMP-like domain
MGVDEFDAMVEEAWNALPETFRAQLHNVEVVVEEWPDDNTLRIAHVRNPLRLLGFYHGVPLTKRGLGYHMVTPDKISLYRQPIALSCRNSDELRALIAHVMRHEIAHHFGISDARLRDIGAY